MKNLFSWARKKLVPTEKEMAMQKGKEFVADIVAGYSIEEQSAVILEVRNMLIEERERDLKATEEYLDRVRKDLSLLKENKVTA